MGEEAHGLHLDGFDEILADPESQTTTIDDKIYVVTESDKNGCSSITVRIFEKKTRRWITPTVLGPNPGPFRGHYYVLLNKDRVLVINQDSLLDDCIWFLEVDTPFVREQRKVIGADVVAWSKGVIGDSFVPVVISGPSGVGKGTLISKLMMEFPSMFGFSVSHTTRLPREKEVDGVHYHFTERSRMEKDVLAGKFLETAAVHGNLYGTSIEAVETVTDAGKRCILDIDVQGARSVRTSALEAIFVFISPPSFDELEKRLRARGTETEEQVQKRLRNAKSELEEGSSPGLFDHILVNDNLETCYENLKKILALSDVSSQPCAKRETPLNDKNEQKFLMQCQSSEGSKKLFLLDVSCIKGGAPGRTRGLKIDVSGKLADVPRISNDNSMFSVAQHAKFIGLDEKGAFSLIR